MCQSQTEPQHTSYESMNSNISLAVPDKNNAIVSEKCISELPSGNQCIPDAASKCSGSASSLDSLINLACSEKMDLPLTPNVTLSENYGPINNDGAEQNMPQLKEGNAELTIPRRGSTSSIQQIHDPSPKLKPKIL